MKKKLFIASLMGMASTIAVAKTIDFNTVIRWNSEVVKTALERAGFLGTNDAYQDVRLTYNRILKELLSKQSFSAQYATQVCMDKCNLSDFLKNGRGRSGKKCPELCADFADQLVAVNNEFSNTGNLGTSEDGLVIHQADGTLKVYSGDKQYYALCTRSADAFPKSIEDRFYGKGPRQNGISGIVFETKTNKAIAGMVWTPGDAHELVNVDGSGRYSGFWFRLMNGCNESYDMLEVENGYLSKFKEIENVVQKAKQECRSVMSVDENVVKKYLDEKNYRDLYNGTVRNVQKCRDNIVRWQAMGLTKDSWERFDELESAYQDFIYMLPNTLINNIEKLSRGIEDSVNKLRQASGRTFDLSFIQTRTKEEAYEEAKAKILNSVVNGDFYIDANKFKCSGKCNHIPGTDDIVTCELGDFTYKVVFDDICQSKVENFFGNIGDRL